jgi:hypothetical protein
MGNNSTTSFRRIDERRQENTWDFVAAETCAVIGEIESENGQGAAAQDRAASESVGALSPFVRPADAGLHFVAFVILMLKNVAEALA